MATSSITLGAANFRLASRYDHPFEDNLLEYSKVYNGPRSTLRDNWADGKMPGSVKGTPTIGDGFVTLDNVNSHIQLPARPFTTGTFWAAFRLNGPAQTRYALTNSEGGLGVGILINGSLQVGGTSMRNPTTPTLDPVTIAAPIENGNFYFVTFELGSNYQRVINHSVPNTMAEETGSAAPVPQTKALRVGAAIGDGTSRAIDIAAAGWTTALYDDAKKAAVYERVKNFLSLAGATI